MKSLSHVLLFETPWTVAYHAPPSVGFSRQEYWSGLLFPSPGDLPNPGIEPRSPALQADALPSEPPGKLKSSLYIWNFLVHVLLEPSLKDFEHYFVSMWNECNCMVIWTFFRIAFLWDWNENWFFQSCGLCWVFQIWSSLYFICSENPLSFTPRVSVHNIWNKSCLSTLSTLHNIWNKSCLSALSTLRSRTYLWGYEDNIIGGNRNLGTPPLWCWHPSDTCLNSGSALAAPGLLLWPLWSQLNKRWSWNFRAYNGPSFILGTLQILSLLIFTRNL